MVAFEYLVIEFILPIVYRIETQRIQLHNGEPLPASEAKRFVDEWAGSDAAQQFTTQLQGAIKRTLHWLATTRLLRIDNNNTGESDDDDEDKAAFPIVLSSQAGATLAEIEDSIFARLPRNRNVPIKRAIAKKKAYSQHNKNK